MSVLKGLELLGIQKSTGNANIAPIKKSFLFGTLLSSFMFSRSPKNTLANFIQGFSKKQSSAQPEKIALRPKSTPIKSLDNFKKILTGTHKKTDAQELNPVTKDAILSSLFAATNPKNEKFPGLKDLKPASSELSSIQLKMSEGKPVLVFTAPTQAGLNKVQNYVSEIGKRAGQLKIELPKIVIRSLGNLINSNQKSVYISNNAKQPGRVAKSTLSQKTVSKQTQTDGSALRNTKNQEKAVNHGSIASSAKQEITQTIAVESKTTAIPNSKTSSNPVQLKNSNFSGTTHHQKLAVSSSPALNHASKADSKVEQKAAKITEQPVLKGLGRNSKSLHTQPQIPTSVERMNAQGKVLNKSQLSREMNLNFKKMTANNSDATNPKFSGQPGSQHNTHLQAQGIQSLHNRAEHKTVPSKSKSKLVQAGPAKDQPKKVSTNNSQKYIPLQKTGPQSTQVQSQQVQVQESATRNQVQLMDPSPSNSLKSELQVQQILVPETHKILNKSKPESVSADKNTPSEPKISLKNESINIDEKSQIVVRKVARGTIQVQKENIADSQSRPTGNDPAVKSEPEAKDKPQAKMENSFGSTPAKSDAQALKMETLSALPGNHTDIRPMEAAPKMMPFGNRIQEIIEKLSASIQKKEHGLTRFKISNSPAGKIEIIIEQENSIKKLKVVVESDKAQREVQKVLPQVQQNLNTKGIEFASLSVDFSQLNTPKESMTQDQKQSSKSKSKSGKEVQDESSESAVEQRNYGYNTIEIIA